MKINAMQFCTLFKLVRRISVWKMQRGFQFSYANAKEKKYIS